MNNRQIYLCENDLEGIFTAVYEAWSGKHPHSQVEIRTREPDNLEFFCVYHQVAKDEEKYRKVDHTIRRKLGEKVYEEICYAAAASEEEKGTAIYQTLVEGLGRTRPNPYVMQNLRNPYIRTVARLHQKVWYEYHHMLGFLRFREVEGSRLVAEIHPDSDLLLLLAPHFSSRFPGENWMILDTGRKTALLHVKDGGIQLKKNVVLSSRYDRTCHQKGEYEELWEEFFHSISIKERENPRLQKQMLPLKYRDCMVEFQN